MKTYVLDASEFTSESAFYDEVSRTFGFFDGFGRNLDALWDSMADRSDESRGHVGISSYETPCAIVWKDSPSSGLSEDFRNNVVTIFGDVSQEVDGIDFRIE